MHALTRHILAFRSFYLESAGNGKVQTFHVGREEAVGAADVRHAASTAEAFREEYEYSRDTNQRFYPERYRGWKTAVLYPFEPGR